MYYYYYHHHYHHHHNQDGLFCGYVLCEWIICAVISRSLSAPHGTSSGCGWRNDLKYGG